MSRLYSSSGDSIIAPAAKPAVTPADPAPTNLFAFYGAGPNDTEGNVDFGNSPYDTVPGSDAQSIVKALGGTKKSDQMPYTDWGLGAVLKDFCTETDTNNDMVISGAEIAAETIKVLGYSWGAIEATNFTRLLATPNAHLAGNRTTVTVGKGMQAVRYTGGWNLTSAVPVAILVTMDPVQHAIVGLSGLLKSTDGPLSNVAKFRNYYETRGGYTTVELYANVGGFFTDEGQSGQIGTFFSSGFTGEALKSASPDTVQVNISTNASWINKTIRRYFGQFSDGSEAYGQAKGSAIQHDTMPFYLHDQVVSDITNG